MGKQAKSKRSLELENEHSHNEASASKRQKGPGHVQKALNQTLHEASAESDSPFSPQATSSLPVEKVKYVPSKSAKHFQQSKSTPKTPGIAKLPRLPSIPDETLEQAVFTHQSYLSGPNQNKLTKSYERLEFLGDAYIELVASKLLYSLYPHMPAGRLSQQREVLVKNKTLANFSLAYGFDERARLRPVVSGTQSFGSLTTGDQYNEKKRQTSGKMLDATPLRPSGQLNASKKGFGPNSPDTAFRGSKHQQKDEKKQYIKTLGDIFEAYVAAIVLSDSQNGYLIAEKWLHTLWMPKLDAQDSAETRTPPPANTKNELAKRVMGRGIRLVYKDSEPPDNSESAAGKTWYTIGAFLTGWGWSQTKLGQGRGLNKSQAGVIAAARALENPLTEQISTIKRAHDDAIAKERAVKEQQENQGRQPSGAENGGVVINRTDAKNGDHEQHSSSASSDTMESVDSADS